MPIMPEHLSALSAYEMLWRSDATEADVDAAFAPGFTDHRPGADGTGVTEFRAHRRAAFDALSGLSARYEPIAGDGHRGAQRWVLRRRGHRQDAELAGGALVRDPRRAHRRALDGCRIVVGLP